MRTEEPAAEQAGQPANQSPQENQTQSANVKVHVSPDLDYSFRNVANIYVGNGDVTFEFGNHHSTMPGNITIANRIVVTMATACELQQQLHKVLLQAQQQMQMQQQMQQNKT